MFLLPTFNAALRPCSVSPAEFTAHERGHFCGSCQRVVQDFSQTENPLADLAAARAISPDGQVCGSFRAAQGLAQPPPKLTQRLKWFLLALVLVVSQGLTAHEALAQVQKAGLGKPRPATSSLTKQATAPPLTDELPNMVFGVVAEDMPSFRGGGMRKLSAYIQKQIKWPEAAGRTCAEGRVFASFTVGANGQVHNVRIVKGLAPILDAEVLRVLRQLTGFKPGSQNGRPVAISFTVPVTFKWK